MYFETEFFVRVVRNQNQGYASRKLFPDKSFRSLKRLVLICFIFTIFLITMHDIDTAVEVHLVAKIVTAFVS